VTKAGVGFVGIGAMGWPMAARLAGSGHLTTVFDADQDRATAFCAEWGLRTSFSPAEVGRQVATVITMLPTSSEVAGVLFGPQSLASELRRGDLVIDMSSGVPVRTRGFSLQLRSKGVAMLDAPVSGGVHRAALGSLAIMVGGPLQIIERAQDILGLLGSSIHRTGSIGSGQAMKSLNNLVSAACLLATVEAVDVGRRFGLDPHLMVDVLNHSSGMTDASQRKIEQFILNEEFNSGFGLDLMVKDVDIAIGLSDQMRRPSDLSRATLRAWSAAQADLGKGRDHTEVANYAARESASIM